MGTVSLVCVACVESKRDLGRPYFVAFEGVFDKNLKHFFCSVDSEAELVALG